MTESDLRSLRRHYEFVRSSAANIMIALQNKNPQAADLAITRTISRLYSMQLKLRNANEPARTPQDSR